MTTVAAPATCEDYDSDVGDAVPDTRTQANVAAKRTPSGTPDPSTSPAASTPTATNGASRGKPPVSVVGPDGTSDSGYSSHTAATIASADSAQSYKTGISSNSGSAGGSIPSAAPRPNVTMNPSPKRRPSQPAVVIPARSDPRAAADKSSPKKSQSRNPSRPRRDTVAEDYPDPTYLRGRRPQPAPIQTRERGYSYSTRPPQSGGYFPTPPSPDAARRPHRLSGAYTQPAIVQQEPPARRRSSSTAPRPMSFHYGMGGMTPEHYYAQMHAAGYGNAVQDPRAPPPSNSAWYATMNRHPSQQRYPMMGSTPPNQVYMPQRALPSPTAPSHELARVQPNHPDDAFSARNPRRSSLGYGPVILQEPGALAPSQTGSTRQYSTRYPNPPSRPYQDDDESDSSSEEEDDPYQMSDSEARRRQDRRDMPPPMVIPNRSHRSSQSYSARGPGPVVVNPIAPPGTPTRRPSQSRPRSGTFTPQDIVARSPSQPSRRQSTTSRPKPAQYYSYNARSRDPTAVQMHVERSVQAPSSGQRLRRRESYLADEPAPSVKHRQDERSAEAYIAAQSRSAGSSRRPSTYRRAIEDRRRPARRREAERPSESGSDSATSSEEDDQPRRRTASQRRPSRPEKLRTRTAPTTQPLTEKALKRRSATNGAGAGAVAGARESDASTSRTSSGREVERHISAPASTISGVERTKDGYKIRVEGGTLDFGDLRGRTLHIRHAEDGSGGAEFLIGGEVQDDGAERKTERSERGRHDKRHDGTSSKTSRTSGSVVTKGRRREMDLMKEDKSSRKSSRRRREVE